MENQNQSKLKLINSAELMDMQLPPIRFTVADILPSGLTVFAGAPKVGKSLFILKLCLAVASGENFWCYPTRKGTVLYLALEDSMMRLQKRLCAMTDEGSENLFFCNRAPRLDEGLLDELKLFKQAHPDTALIVIDTFLLVRAPAKNNGQNMYERDYVEMNRFQQFAIENDLSIVLIHHGKKAEESDPYKQASGSMGMTAAADSYLLLKRLDRIAREGTLYISGRDIESRDVKIKMNDDAIWELAEELEYELERTDPYIRAIVLYLLSANHLRQESGEYSADDASPTVDWSKEYLRIQASELADGANKFLELSGDEALKPNMIKKKLVEYHTQLEALGFKFESERTGQTRTLVFRFILEKVRRLYFEKGKLPIEISARSVESEADHDSMTGDSCKNTVTVIDSPEEKAIIDTSNDLFGYKTLEERKRMHPNQLMNRGLHERHKRGMYQELDEFFANGYTVEENGVTIHKTDKPVEYYCVTGGIPGKIDELIQLLLREYENFPKLKTMPIYRRVIIKHLKDLAEYIEGEIRELSDDATGGATIEKNEAVTCHAVTEVKN